MAENITLGSQGEEIAAGYLHKKGYQILHRNWRYKHKEIDIIAQDGDTIVIVEVKTRGNDYFESPKEAVSKKKQKFLIEAANHYIENNEIDLETRFDIVSIVSKNGAHDVEHIFEAYHPGL